MAYIPQFIPTDTRVLQSTLDQYQKGYDTETTRQNQVNDVYSAIPTNGISDTVDKNKIMEGFSGKLAELDKKYNYDRSNQQYAKDLAHEITGLRSNPLWGHVQQKEELNKMRTQLISQRGQDYVENFNPNDIAVKDAGKLQSWVPGDLKDVKLAAAAKGKERSTSYKGTTTDYPNRGILRYTDVYGDQTIEEAKLYLDSPAGKTELDSVIQSTGLNPTDPKVRQAAYESMLSTSVGDNKIREMVDPMESINARTAAAKGKKSGTPSGSRLVEVGVVSPITNAYAVTKESQVSEARASLDDLTKQLADPTLVDPVQKNILAEKVSQAQLSMDEINNVLTQYRTDEKGTKTMTAEKALLKKYFPKLNDAQLNNEVNALADNLVETNFTNRFITGAETTGNITNKPGINYIDSKVQEVYNAELKANPENTKFDSSFTNGKYNFPETAAERAKKKAEVFKSELLDFYSGNGNYKDTGYKQNVEERVTKEFKTGSMPKLHEYSLPSDMMGTEKTEMKTFVSSNLDVLSHVDVKKGKENGQWDKGEANKLKEIFSDPNTELKFYFDNEGVAYIGLNETKSGKNAMLKVDPSKNSVDLMADLYKRTGDERFLSQQYAGFNIPSNKEYSLGDKNSGVYRQFENYFRGPDGKADLSSFDDLRVKKLEDGNGNFTYEVYKDKDTVPFVKYPNKMELISKLSDARDENNNELLNVARQLNNRPIKIMDFSNIKGFNEYKELVGQQENKGSYGGPPNKSTGALGKYQFLPSTLKKLGFNVTSEQFLNDPTMQEEAMNRYIADSINTISNYGYQIDPNNLTQEAIALLTVAHYGGPKAANALINNSPWLKEKQTDTVWNPKTGTDEVVEYPSVIEYLQQSMGIDSTKLKFGSSKK